ncbi:MAG: hypothetical protein MI750_00950 [Xanthomonadales bacterium]|jgi:hypothetical protein|nr:hypothetical protein [Xanthomonadales bacterium]
MMTVVKGVAGVLLVAISFKAEAIHTKLVKSGDAVLICEAQQQGTYCDVWISGQSLKSTDWAADDIWIAASNHHTAEVACFARQKSYMGQVSARVTFGDGTEMSLSKSIPCDPY